MSLVGLSVQLGHAVDVCALTLEIPCMPCRSPVTGDSANGYGPRTPITIFISVAGLLCAWGVGVVLVA